MDELMQFQMFIEIRNDNGIDVEALIRNASTAIANKAKHKFRVIGEAKIVAIFEGYEPFVAPVVNMVTSEIMKLGPYNVTCTPLTRLDNWEGLLGLGSNFDDASVEPEKLRRDFAVWYEYAFDRGLSDDECDRTWRETVLSILRQRRDSRGMMDIEIFKVLGERRVYVFSCKNADESWETDMWKFNMEDRIFKNARLVTKI